MKTESKSYHVTTNTTNTPWTDSVQLLGMSISASSAGSAWVVKVQNKESPTPKILYTATVAVGSTYFAFTDAGGLEMTNGIDVVTTGTTPGVLDVFISALRLGHD